MCGPYVAICSSRIVGPNASSRRVRNVLRLLFNAGRVTTYVSIGVLAGAFGQIAGAMGQARGYPGGVALAAGVFALFFALSLAGAAPSVESLAASLGLDRLLRAGSLEAFHAPPYLSAFLLGNLQGLFPCALVYGGASRAAASASPGRGALTMLVFGLGTLPALLALTFASKALPEWMRSRRGAAGLVGALGILLVLRGLAGWGLIPHTRLW